jgi:hypothetical protein
MKNINMGGALDFFINIPDDILVKIAEEDWGALKRLCIALTIDVQLIEESSYESTSNRRNLC